MAERPVCPHCESVNRAYFLQPKNGHRTTSIGKVSYRRLWKCADCRKPFSVLVVMIIERSQVPLSKLLLALFMRASSKNGVAAYEVHRTLGVTNKTAWFMMHRIREAMKRGGLVGSLQGVVVADETFIGGDEHNKHAKDRKGVGGGPHHKVAVLTLIEKHSGEARSRVVPDVTGATLHKAIEEQVGAAGSLLYSDEHAAYGPVGKRFLRHETVAHSTGEYVGRRGTTTNDAEGFFSQLKRSLDGTHHHVSREHLPRYLAELDFRYSTRKISDTARMA